MTHFSISRNWIRFGNYAVMIFGHCIIIWWPNVWYLRLGDYFCYSIFAFLAGVGLQETSNTMKYIGSMILLAVVSQWPYSLAGVGPDGHLNIMFPLAISATLVWFAKEYKTMWPIVLGVSGATLAGMLAVIEGTLIMYLVNTLYEYIPKFSKGRLKINKYWVYSIYPGHLLVLGGLRQIIT